MKSKFKHGSRPTRILLTVCICLPLLVAVFVTACYLDEHMPRSFDAITRWQASRIERIDTSYSNLKNIERSESIFADLKQRKYIPCAGPCTAPLHSYSCKDGTGGPLFDLTIWEEEKDQWVVEVYIDDEQRCYRAC